MENNKNISSSEVLTFDEINEQVSVFQEKLDQFRNDGIFKIRRLKEENENISKDKKVSKEIKKEVIETNKESIRKAKKYSVKTKFDIAELEEDALEIVNKNYPHYYNDVKKICADRKVEAKAKKEEALKEAKIAYDNEVASINEKYFVKILEKDEKISFNNELKLLANEHKENLNKINEKYQNIKLSKEQIDDHLAKVNEFKKQQSTESLNCKEEYKEPLNNAKADKANYRAIHKEFRTKYFGIIDKYDTLIQDENTKFNDLKTNIYKERDNEISLENKNYEDRYNALYAKYGVRILSKVEVESKKVLLDNASRSYKNKLFEIKNAYKKERTDIKNTLHEAFIHKINLVEDITNNRFNFVNYFAKKFENFVYRFKLSDFLLKNGLYIIIIIFFIAAVIASFVQGNNLLSSANLLAIMSQSSTKIFFALGVAGLILLGGTDLSIGRLTGLGASISCLFLASTVYEKAFFGITVDLLNVPVAIKIILTLLTCIVLCVIVSSVAGFFTAKFKMHPFITTLSTQLVVFGLMMISFTKYPAFNMENQTKLSIVGNNNINLIIYAIVAIAIVWFIWNKTKFGKNMYAVGGNSEAASVSGISVFWTTLLVFVMAGVLYGLGGFFEGARTAVGNANTGSGTELDAIAACVIGGISFSGGIGKIRGAVIGAIIFTGLTYCLTNLGFNTNIQYIFKGVIIMTAVCLDSLKYLKKK